MDTIINEAPQRVKIGRPKKYEIFDRETYNKQYYQNNKSKYMGDYLCPSCNLLCSLSNKSRHLKSKTHLEKIN
jgi:hypothetical protein